MHVFRSMGNYYITICDQEATPQQATDLAQRVVAYLTAEGIADSVPYPWFSEGVGYLVGPAFEKATVYPEQFSYHFENGRLIVHPGFEKGLSPSPTNPTRPLDEELSVVDTCVRVSTKREVHYSIGAQVWCSLCGYPFDDFARGCDPSDPEAQELWWDAVSDWNEGSEGRLTCPGCRQSLTAPEMACDPPWGFGYLAFEFWNWGVLRLDFIRDVALILGHEVVVPYGKL